MADSRIRTSQVNCPCCGYPTLREAGAYEICILCWWEDDGQGEDEADVVRGGPNGDLSLTVARANFEDHLAIYPIGHDTRIGGADTREEVIAKRAIVEGVQRIRRGVAEEQTDNIWAQIEAAERVLQAETDRKIREQEEHLTERPA